MKWNTTDLLNYAEELSDREVSQLLNKAAAMIDDKHARNYVVTPFKSYGVKRYCIESKRYHRVISLHFKRSRNPIICPRSKRTLLNNIIIADSSNRFSCGIVNITHKLLAEKLKEEQKLKHPRYLCYRIRHTLVSNS